MNPRPHPLGIQSHPEWDSVWDRYFAADEALNPPEPANDTDEDVTMADFPGRALMWGAAAALGLAAMLIGALV